MISQNESAVMIQFNWNHAYEIGYRRTDFSTHDKKFL